MDKKKDKRYALRLLKEKRAGTRSQSMEVLSDLTGYSVRQLQRFNKQLIRKEDTEEILKHGNAGKSPINIAQESESEYLRSFKIPYPNITIAQFRDFFFEDVLNDPSKAEDVKRYGLKPRSESWFRNLFIKEGWISPRQRRTKSVRPRSHLLRPPASRRGLLVQIDGTPFDWFDDGRMYCLHLAIDDATSEILSGYFAPHECQIGYCTIMKSLFERHGIPMALYSDRHTILCNVKDGSTTQFALMMEDMGIEMIYALSAQAKGRVERANGTLQLRLPNDILRFRNKGIRLEDYDDLNGWFNDFYISYYNSKMAFLPLDPNDAFIDLEEGFDYSRIFCLRDERVIQNGSISLNACYYAPYKDNDKPLYIRDGVKVDVRVDIFTDEVWILYHEKKYICKKIQEKKRRKTEKMADHKDLDSWLKQHGETQ